MIKTKNIVIANWKMNPDSLLEAKKLFKDVYKNLKGIKGIKVVICPPAVFLSELCALSKGSVFSFGVQDVSKYQKGSHTGEISAKAATNFSSYAIIGHSERRALGESNNEVSQKILEAFKAKLSPILCIGEKKRDSDGKYLDFLREQITESLNNVPKNKIKEITVAYEPIWAIGGEKAISLRHIHEISIFIKKVLGDSYGKSFSSIPILYGGSVTSKNIKELKLAEGIQGFLVGHESLKAKNFTLIVETFATRNDS